MLTVLTDSQRVDAVRARGAGVCGSATIILKRSNLRRMVRVRILLSVRKRRGVRIRRLMESMAVQPSYQKGQT